LSWQLFHTFHWPKEIKKSAYFSVGLFAIVTSLIGAILMLGPTLKVAGQTFKVFRLPIPLPYVVLYYLIPGFKAFRASSRWEVVFDFGLSLLFGLALQNSQQKKVIRVAVVVVLTVVLWLTQVPRLQIFAVPTQLPPIYDVLAQQKDNVVAEFPVYSWRMLKYAYREDDRLLYQAQHGKILYNGVSGFTPPAREAEMDNLWKTFPSHKTLAALQQQGVSLILLHFGEYDQLHQDQFTYLDTLSPSSTTVHAELKQLPELELLTCQGSDCLYHLTGVVH
jgi:hypothetical protein